MRTFFEPATPNDFVGSVAPRRDFTDTRRLVHADRVMMPNIVRVTVHAPAQRPTRRLQLDREARNHARQTVVHKRC